MIYIAGDKHSFDAMKVVEEYLKSHNLQYTDFGVKSATEDMKLEDMIPRITAKVLESKNNLGILSCGTGIGVEVGANKFSGIRASLATDEKIAEWSKVYDDCNILCLVGWGAERSRVNKILDAWFSAKYDGDKDRLKMFEAFNKWH